MTPRSTIPLPILTGVEVKHRRELLKLSQPALADMMGMHEQSLSALERGRKAITLPNARHFGLLFAWLDEHGATKEAARPVAPAAPASLPVPTQALPYVLTRPVCKWLSDDRTRSLVDPVMLVDPGHYYWESRRQPDGSDGPWRHKLRSSSPDEIDDVFVGE